MTSEPEWFRTTMWSAILGAAQGRGEQAERLVRLYRRPIVRFAEARLPPSADAEALADDVLLAVLDPKFLARADRTKGRFRQLLLAVTRHAIADEVRRGGRQKRGGGLLHLPLDELERHPATREDEEQFAGSWASEVLAEGMRRFCEECRAAGRLEFEAVRLHHIEGLSLADSAARIERAPNYVNVLLYQGRQMLRRHIIETVRDYCSTREEFDEEVRVLLARLGWTGDAES